MTQVNEMYKRLFTRSKVAASDLLVETTWADLFMKTENGQLIPGQMYRITDYTLVTPDSFEYGEETIPLESAGKRFDVVVTALSEDTLSEDAVAMHNRTQDSFSTSDLNKWALKYSIYNTVKIPLYGNTLPYPYVKRPLYNPQSMVDARIQDDVAEITLSGGRTILMRVDRNDGEYATFYDADEHAYYYTLEGVEEEETFYTKVPYPKEGDGLYISTPNGMDVVYTIQSIEWSLCPQGKGTIYRMVDEFNNSLPCDFKNLKWGYTQWMLDVGQFTEGMVNTTDFIFSVMNSTPSEDYSLEGDVSDIYINKAYSIGHFIVGEGVLNNICIENVSDLLIVCFQSSNENIVIHDSYQIYIADEDRQNKNIKITDSIAIYLLGIQNLTIDGVDLSLYETQMPEGPDLNLTAPKTMGIIKFRNSTYPYIFWKEIAENGPSGPYAPFNDGTARNHLFAMVDMGFIYNSNGEVDGQETPDTWIPITVLAAPLT